MRVEGIVSLQYCPCLESVECARIIRISVGGLWEPSIPSKQLVQFDPFLSEHINIPGNKGKDHTSYLSKDVCEEFIYLIGSRH